MKYVLMFIGAIVVLILSSIWYGYVLSVMWGWFIVHAFHVSSISVPLAIGLSSVVGMFRSYPDTNKKSDKSPSEVFTRAIAYSFFGPLFVLLFGYIIHLFV